MPTRREVGCLLSIGCTFNISQTLNPKSAFKIKLLKMAQPNITITFGLIVTITKGINIPDWHGQWNNIRGDTDLLWSIMDWKVSSSWLRFL
jgi:hypothetical protein